MKKCLLIFLLLVPAIAWAQTVTDNWYFGWHAGVNFTSGEPVALLNSAMGTSHACATISNEDGGLLFYTNGVTIWNRDHETMPNGLNLMGHPSSSQTMIVPRPFHPDQYYIFTVDAAQTNFQNGLRYSLVDMDLDGGLGDVVSTQKNILLHAPMIEQVTAVQHATENQIWVISHEFDSDAFHAYLVREDGVDHDPVISHAGEVIGPEPFFGNGNTKVSPSGNKIAMSNWNKHTLGIYDFNSNTGVVSNAIIDTIPHATPYGVEFSPSGNMLYFSVTQAIDSINIIQYDLAAGSPQQILNSQHIIFLVHTQFAGLQIASDGKIYVSLSGIDSLSVIHNPEVYGDGCNFEPNSIYLGEGFRRARWGLPQFVQSNFYFEADFTYTTECYGTPTQFYENSSETPDSAYWDFGDPASGSNNYSTLFNPTHLFTSFGNFNVTLTIYVGEKTSVKEKTVRVKYVPAIDLGNDTSLCTGNSIILDPGSGFASYLWQNGETTQTLQADTSGLYWVEVETPDGCAARDSIMIQFNQNYLISHDTSICFGDSVYLQDEWQKESGVYSDSMITVYGCDSILQTNLAVRDTFLVYQQMEICEGDSVFLQGEWQTQTGTYTDIFQSQLACDSTVVTGLTVSEIIHTNRESSICMGDSIFLQGDYRHEAGIYYDTTQSAFGCDSITITELFVNMMYDLLQDTGICAGDSILLGGEYRQEEGVYYDAFQTISGCDSLIATSLEVYPIPQVNLGHDTLLQQGETLLLDAFFPGAEYLWQDGSDNPQYYVDMPGSYHVLVSNLCGFASDTMVVEYDDENGGAVECELRMPNAFTPNGDGLNDVFLPVMECEPLQYNLWIYDRWGKEIFHSSNPLQAWEGKEGGTAVPAGAYAYILEYSSHSSNNFTRQLKGTVVVLR